MPGFPFAKVKGNASQIGEGVGKLFSSRVNGCFKFYQTLFGNLLGESSADKINARLKPLTQPFADEIGISIPQYAQEIEALAGAAELDPWCIYFLNARTEILNKILADKKAGSSASAAECTSLFFPQNKLLGQTWDWHPELEKIAIVLEIERLDGHRLITFTEPGIIGKIGFNNKGVGICANILFSNAEVGGIPTHIMQRAVLDASSLEAAASKIRAFRRGTSANILMADVNGNYKDFEFNGTQIVEPQFTNGAILHTNHYVAEHAGAIKENPSSYHRADVGVKLYAKLSNGGVEEMKSILSDRSSSEFPICRSYKAGLYFLVGTVATIVIDLKARKMHLLKGESGNESWEEFGL